jgi:hypothetical protein
MATLLIALAALIAANFVCMALDPWASSPGNLGTEDQNAGDERAQMMEAITLSCF